MPSSGPVRAISRTPASTSRWMPSTSQRSEPRTWTPPLGKRCTSSSSSGAGTHPSDHDPAAGGTEVDGRQAEERVVSGHVRRRSAAGRGGRRRRAARRPGGRCRAPSGGRRRWRSTRRSTPPGRDRSRPARSCCRSAAAGRGRPSPSEATKPKRPVAVLAEAEHGDRSVVDVELDRHAPAALAVVDAEAAQQRLARADREVGRSVVAHLDDVVAEVQRLQLGERAAARRAGP